MNIGQLLHI